MSKAKAPPQGEDCDHRDAAAFRAYPNPPPPDLLGNRGSFDFAEAVRRVIARGSLYVCRQHERAPRVYEMRELCITMDGHIYVRVDGTDEQRHLTTTDVRATDWKETL